MSTFSLPAPSAPSCYDLQRSPFQHAHSTARQPQLRRFTDLCSRIRPLGDACAKVVRCSMGQVQSTLPFSCCSSPCSQSKFLQKSHLNASGWSCLCCRTMGTPATSNGRMVRCLPECQPRTSCASLMLRRWIARHTRRQNRCVAHTPRPRSCTERMPAVPALHDATCPAPALPAL